MRTPDLHELFTYNGSKYRVTGYAMIKVGYSKFDDEVTIRLMNCTKENACAVIGHGICGCIAPLTKIELENCSSMLPKCVRESIESHVEEIAKEQFDRMIDFGGDTHARNLLRRMK